MYKSEKCSVPSHLYTSSYIRTKDMLTEVVKDSGVYTVYMHKLN